MTERAVRVEQSGPVTTVFLYRPARRNAVDGPHRGRSWPPRSGRSTPIPGRPWSPCCTARAGCSAPART